MRAPTGSSATIAYDRARGATDEDLVTRVDAYER
jgi:hypothetical protein